MRSFHLIFFILCFTHLTLLAQIPKKDSIDNESMDTYSFFVKNQLLLSSSGLSFPDVHTFLIKPYSINKKLPFFCALEDKMSRQLKININIGLDPIIQE